MVATAELVQTSFDYGILDDEARSIVQDATVGIHTLCRRAAQDIVKGLENVMSFLELIEMDVKAIRSYREEGADQG